MGPIDLKIEDLVLDHENPRITHAEGQQEALQKIVKDQKTKLVKLAQSIAEKGLNPMDRFLGAPSASEAGTFHRIRGQSAHGGVQAVEQSCRHEWPRNAAADEGNP